MPPGLIASVRPGIRGGRLLVRATARDEPKLLRILRTTGRASPGLGSSPNPRLRGTQATHAPQRPSGGSGSRSVRAHLRRRDALGRP